MTLVKRALVYAPALVGPHAREHKGKVGVVPVNGRARCDRRSKINLPLPSVHVRDITRVLQT